MKIIEIVSEGEALGLLTSATFSWLYPLSTIGHLYNIIIHILLRI